MSKKERLPITLVRVGPRSLGVNDVFLWRDTHEIVVDEQGTGYVMRIGDALEFRGKTARDVGSRAYAAGY